jgi:hypothetical protein
MSTKKKNRGIKKEQKKNRPPAVFIPEVQTPTRLRKGSPCFEIIPLTWQIARESLAVVPFCSDKCCRIKWI